MWLPIELLGVSQMDTCYLNTQDQKNRVLEEAKETFNDEFVSNFKNNRDSKLLVRTSNLWR